MIFVTVGTHEQQFNRLMKEVDRLKGENIIKEDVIMQIGYSTYEPKFCKWNKMISYEEMNENIEKARIVITHGGPASFLAPLQIGKIPIVVPRQKKFGEHVNDHQLEFCRIVAQRNQNIIVVENVKNLENIIGEYNDVILELSGVLDDNNMRFNKNIDCIVSEMFGLSR